jgi:ankyrin repeat protein
MPTQHRAKQAMTPEQKQVINRMLASAVKVWDVELIRGAVESGADTQELLVRAVAKKNPDLVKLSLQYGADVNALVATGDRKFQPLLHYAHENFQEDIFTTILQQGVSIDLKNPQGETVVQRAARSGDFDRMRLYLAKGADLGGSAQEVLIKALDKKDLPAIQWAVDHGADVQARVRSGDDVMNTTLHLAFNSFREDIMDYILKAGVSIDARNSAGETVLHLAARQTDSKKAEYLLKQGADPLAVTYAGVSVLDEAMKSVSSTESRDYDRDRYDSYSGSYNSSSSASSKTKDAKAVMALLIAKVKEVYGVEPFNTAMQRDITVGKPIAVGKPRDEAGPKKDP